VSSWCRTYIKMEVYFRYLLMFCEINIVNCIMAAGNFEIKWYFCFRIKEIKVIFSFGI